MYVEYIFMNAACETKMFATAVATCTDSWPLASAAVTCAGGCSSCAAAFSSAGKKLLSWNVNRASMPPKTTLRSGAGTTVSLLDELVSALMGSDPGLM
jgi:hypothetical protein